MPSIASKLMPSHFFQRRTAKAAPAKPQAAEQLPGDTLTSSRITRLGRSVKSLLSSKTSSQISSPLTESDRTTLSRGSVASSLASERYVPAPPRYKRRQVPPVEVPDAKSYLDALITEWHESRPPIVQQTTSAFHDLEHRAYLLEFLNRETTQRKFAYEPTRRFFKAHELIEHAQPKLERAWQIVTDRNRPYTEPANPHQVEELQAAQSVLRNYVRGRAMLKSLTPLPSPSSHERKSVSSDGFRSSISKSDSETGSLPRYKTVQVRASRDFDAMA